jgi:hypothetical protein
VVDITAADIITEAVEGITAGDSMPVMSRVRMARPTRQESIAAPSGEASQRQESVYETDPSSGQLCWSQFVAMMFCQLAQAKSLREIIDGLACCEGKLNHLGLQEGPKRSTLSYANSKAPLGIVRASVL